MTPKQRSIKVEIDLPGVMRPFVDLEDGMLFIFFDEQRPTLGMKLSGGAVLAFEEAVHPTMAPPTILPRQRFQNRLRYAESTVSTDVRAKSAQGWAATQGADRRCEHCGGWHICSSLVFRWKSGSGCGHALWHREGCLRSSGRDVGRRLASSLS